jgi:hypothetical protein
LISEMDKCVLNVLVLSEVRWSGKGDVESGNCTMFYSGGVEAEKVVAVMLRNDVVKLLTKVECYGDRLMYSYVKISAKPVDIVVVQVYMPTTNHDEDEIEKKLHQKISEILHQEGKGKVNAIVM